MFVLQKIMAKYFLVEVVDDGILYVVQSNRKRVIGDQLVLVPYENMGRYKAELNVMMTEMSLRRSESY